MMINHQNQHSQPKDEDQCPFCGGLLHGYMRRELVEYEDNDYQMEMIDYDECETCNREPYESGDYEGVVIYG